MTPAGNDLYEALLTGALAFQAVLFGLLGIFYTIHQTISLAALSDKSGPQPKPEMTRRLTNLSKLTAWLALLTVVTSAFCFGSLTTELRVFAIALPLALTIVVMVAVSFYIAYRLMD